jgi:hypothetical protein
MIPSNNASPSVPENSTHKPKGLSVDGPPIGSVSAADAAVVTVTVAAVAEVPPSAMELGDTEQADCAGAPLQLRVTVCLKPPPGAIEIV